MDNTATAVGGWKAAIRNWVGTQALILGIAVVLAWLFPSLQTVFNYAWIGLIKQLLPGSVEIVSSTSQGGARETLLGPVDVNTLIRTAGIALLIDLLLLNPLVYLFRRHVLPFCMEVGDERTVIRKLRGRAMLQRVGAFGNLALIVGLLLIGLLIFIGAERLTGYEVVADQPAAADAGKPKEAKATVGEEKSNDIYFVASAIATRIAAAVMLIFLVKILASLYRYNARMAAFYNGRADALEIMGSLGTKNPGNRSPDFGAKNLEKQGVFAGRH